MQTFREVVVWAIPDDPLFVLMAIEKDLGVLFDRLKILGRICAGVAAISFIMMLVSLLFYENEQHHIILGLLSSLQVFAFISSTYGYSLKNRYFIYAQIFSISLFLGGISIFLASYIFIGE